MFVCDKEVCIVNKKNRIETFESLFNAHYVGLYSHALSFVRDEEEAKDIVMDTYEYLWNNLYKIDLSDTLRPFLYTLVYNRCIDFLRRKKSRERYLRYSYESVKTTEDYRGYEELIQKVMSAIDQLAPQTSVVFKKCFIERKKYREVSEELNISVNTVKWHIVKGLGELRNRLSDTELFLLLILFKKNAV
ncbi:RNA polymerase sigma-70 factor [Sanguibacteroides justesenii]|nr:RNA polymerase sigma-70 factor [Sanguibacteroides justesenii]